MMKKREQIRKRLTVIFREVFDDDDLEVFDGMTAEDIEEWDSLMHITLVMAIEKEFDIRLNAGEVGKLENVGAMMDILMARTT